MIFDTLFPTPICLMKLPIFDEQMLEFTKSMQMMNNTNNLISKNRNVLDDIIFEELNAKINLSLREFFNRIYCPQTDLDIYVTQSWININYKGMSHHSHKHPNSFISGVYYIKADPAYHTITFQKDIYDNIRFPSKNYNKFNSEFWYYPIESGDLIMFPSNLKHFVNENTVDEERISLGFNSFLKGTIGDDEVSFNLELKVGNLK